ncbi:putative exported protein [Halobacteriovorax marinus SJ]|uniref:Exported protein n=1 Tax=Halobacteriovorax marinus (strain ATCC BAA-682 / DSM 15412 / SJ) TaxID=862908 RepID=E1WZB7_HALMS|nr:serine protease [Halobacteriovorax marinus]CBW27805.1 putative exported protein [Halobacteriovorax marinus SJ]
MQKFIFLFLISLVAHGGIVNSDDRHEIQYSPLHIQEIAKSIAALIPKKNMTQLPNGDYKLHGLSYVDDLNFCSDERFVNEQKMIANCSASLIGRKDILTAAHCIDEDHGYSIRDYYIVFDYKFNAETKSHIVVPKSSVFEINKLKQYTFDFPGDKDIARLELKEAPKNRKILKLARKRISLSSEIYMLGFPFGLPMKYHDNGYITSETTFLNGQDSFTHSLDSFSVNSGSSIFDANTNEIVGVLVRGTGLNYTLDKERNCNIWGQGDHHFGEANYIDLLLEL